MEETELRSERIKKKSQKFLNKLILKVKNWAQTARKPKIHLQYNYLTEHYIKYVFHVYSCASPEKVPEVIGE